MIYLAAPLSTGFSENQSPEEAKSARAVEINRATAKLMAQGLAVYSPVSHGLSVAPYVENGQADDHRFWMSHCHKMLEKSRALWVLTLPGWDKSEGVQAEILHATRRGIPVQMLSPESI